MAVYIELQISDISRAFNNYVDKKRKKRRGGAGESNVRRPLRGLEIKDDTYATLRVVKTDGTEIPLFDSSDPGGESTNYANFILQSVQDARMEKQQIIETFGEPYIFFFGEAPRFIDVSAVLINSLDFNWRAEWWKNYDEYLRGTRLVEMGAKAYLFYDEIIVEGFIVQAAAQEDSMNPLSVNLNFRMFVTNYANISFVGDPFYPVRESANVPEDVNLYDISALDSLAPRKRAVDEDGIDDFTQKVFLDWYKKFSIAAAKKAVAGAQSMHQLLLANHEYNLRSIGMSNNVTLDGTSLLSDLFKDSKKRYAEKQAANASKQAEAIHDAARRKDYTDILNASKDGNSASAAKMMQEAVSEAMADAAKKAVQDVSNSVKELAGNVKKQLIDNFTIHTGPEQFGSTRGLTDFIRRNIQVTPAYPGTNIDQFMRDVEATLNRGADPPPNISRNFPYRSLISDNIDEYTQGDIYGRSTAALNRSRIDGLVDAPAKNPSETVNDELCKRGATPKAKEFFAFGMASWSPGQGWQTSSGSGAGQLPPGVGFSGGRQGGAFGGYGVPQKGLTLNFGLGSKQPNYPGAVNSFGNQWNPAFSKTPGATIGIGGAFGGSMGGAIGANVGGAWGGYGANTYGNPNFPQAGNPLQQQMNQNPFGLSTGDAYGNVNPQGAAYKYTAGYGPDGWYSQGGQVNGENPMSPQQNAFGGGATLTAAANLNLSIGASGAFGIHATAGSLDPTLQGNGKEC